MGSTSKLVLCLFFSCVLFHCSYGARQLQALVEEQPLGLTYHKGALLTGRISVNLIWYGKFTPAQRAIISDFITSISSPSSNPVGSTQPSVATWWKTIDEYYVQSKTRLPALTLSQQILDESYSLGKSLKDADLAKLAARGAPKYAINVVLTSDDVVVEGFCMSRCGSHGASPRSKAGRFTYIWVGNSASQCPGQCAWPFHQPIYGPQTPPLLPPNGDVGLDGMVINVATLLAGTVTNPKGAGYFQGDAGAPVEVAAVCPGVYGKGAYPGYAGELLVDSRTGASYNVVGKNGRKYLVPAMYDPTISACTPMV